MESIAYGNRHQMIRFDVRITKTLVDDLMEQGYIDKDEFDYQEYLDEEWEEWGCSPLAEVIMDAIIVWYEDRVERMNEKLEEPHCHDEWDDMWNKATDLDKIILLSVTGDNIKGGRELGYIDLIEVHDVDPNDPYRS